MRKAYLIVTALFAMLAPVSTATATPIPAFDLMRAADFQQVTMSPDRNTIAFIFSETKKFCLTSRGEIIPEERATCDDSDAEYRASYKIGFLDVSDGTVGEFVTGDLPDDFYVSWLRWGNNQKVIAALSKRTTVNARSGSYSIGGARLMAVDKDSFDLTFFFGDDTRLMKNNRFISRITDFLPQDPEHVLVPLREDRGLDLWKVNISSGKAVKVADGTPRTFRWFTNSSGEPIMRFDRDFKRASVDVFALSASGKQWQKIKTIRVRQKINQAEEFDFQPVGKVNENYQVHAISYTRSDPRISLKIFDINKKDFIKTVYEHPSLDIRGALFDRDTGNYSGIWYYDDILEYDFVDSYFNDLLSKVKSFFPENTNVTLLRYSRSPGIVFLSASTPDNPTTYFLFDPENETMVPVIQSRTTVNNYQFGKADIFSIPVRDGTVIKAYLTHPSAGRSPDAPLIVMPHGGPEVRDYYSYNATIQFLASRGYQVLQVNFRGSSGYGRDFAEAGYGQWGGLMQDDLTDAVKFIHRQGFARADNTCIVGASYGGYAALMGAIKTPELYQCVVSVAGVSDLQATMRDDQQNFGYDSPVYEYLLESIGDPRKDRDKLKMTSPVNQADKITVPVLLVHGDRDRVVSVDQSQRMFQKLKSEKVNVELITYQYAGHSSWPLETELDYLARLERFLGTHLR